MGVAGGHTAVLRRFDTEWTTAVSTSAVAYSDTVPEILCGKTSRRELAEQDSNPHRRDQNPSSYQLDDPPKIRSPTRPRVSPGPLLPYVYVCLGYVDVPRPR